MAARTNVHHALALELGLGIARLHRDLDAATIVTSEEMRAQTLGLELHCALLPALPELLPALTPVGLLVVGVTVSSALRSLVLAIIELLPLAKTARS